MPAIIIIPPRSFLPLKELEGFRWLGYPCWMRSSWDGIEASSSSMES
jgi:hypothetical protein